MINIDLHKKLQAAAGEMNLRLQLAFTPGNFIALYGESGAGKTSTLRMLAGLLKPDQGKIIINNKTWFDSEKKINIPPQQRKIGFVFQDYALFPNMSIRENLEFALRKGQAKSIVSELIDLVELGELQSRKPTTLSGGQKQRVALARALVQQPELLLLDEPLSALDNKIRLKLQDYLLQVHKQYGLTTILISHDIGEIIKLADEIVTLEKGQVVHRGTPDDLFINKNISGKFRFNGEVLKIEKQEVVYILTALVHSSVVKVIIDEQKAAELKVGDRVILVSKGFNPLVFKA